MFSAFPSTGRPAASLQTGLLQAAIEHLPHGIAIFDIELRLCHWNRRLTAMLNLPADGLAPGMRFDELATTLPGFTPRSHGNGPVTEAPYFKAAQEFRPYCVEHTLPDGRVHQVQSQALSQDGRLQGLLVTHTDVTEHHRNESDVHYLTQHDALTGLMNRSALLASLQQALDASAPTMATTIPATAPAALPDNDDGGSTLAVVLLDLDRFKHINDSLGHDAGDALLIQVAERLHRFCSTHDRLARLGGDEFALVLPHLPGRTAAERIVTQLLACLSQPYEVRDADWHVTPSIGVSLYPDDGATASALLRHADTAMYHAKALGRANCQFFTEALDLAATERTDLERKLRHAVARKEFELWYQPRYEAGSHALTGFEALIRWRHPENGLIAPARFIPLAEETGVITDIGAWVLAEACQQAAGWTRFGRHDLRVAVNLSVKQLRDERLPDTVAAILARSGLPAKLLELEITESTVMEKPEETIELLRRLKALGVGIAIDDFGTGYSSLSYLKLFPLDRLKIDKSFVSDIEHDPNDAAIVAAAVSLAHNLGLSVTAEGVESAVQVSRLTSLGCDELQGYHFGPPVPVSELERRIRASHAEARPD